VTKEKGKKTAFRCAVEGEKPDQEERIPSPEDLNEACKGASQKTSTREKTTSHVTPVQKITSDKKTSEGGGHNIVVTGAKRSAVRCGRHNWGIENGWVDLRKRGRAGVLRRVRWGNHGQQKDILLEGRTGNKLR